VTYIGSSTEIIRKIGVMTSGNASTEKFERAWRLKNIEEDYHLSEDSRKNTEASLHAPTAYRLAIDK